MTEPDAGSDLHMIQMKAIPVEGGYVLNGTKQFITNAAFADIMTVVVQCASSSENLLSAFVVDLSSDGVTIGPEVDKVVVVGSSTCPVYFENVFVPEENRLGQVGDGQSIGLTTLLAGRLKIAMGCAGGCRHLLNKTLRYAAERHQFGNPIHHYGANKSVLTQQTLLAFAAESLLQKISSEMDSYAKEEEKNKRDTLSAYRVEIGILKVFCSEAYSMVGDGMREVVSAYALVEDLGKFYRDMTVGRVVEGTNTVNRALIIGAAFLKKFFSQYASRDFEIEFLERKSAVDRLFLNHPLHKALLFVETAKEWVKLMFQVVLKEKSSSLNIRDEEDLLTPLSHLVISARVMDASVQRALILRENQHSHSCLAEKLATLIAYNHYQIIEETAKVLLTYAYGDQKIPAQLKEAIQFASLTLSFDELDSHRLKKEVAEDMIRQGNYPFFP